MNKYLAKLRHHARRAVVSEIYEPKVSGAARCGGSAIPHRCRIHKSRGLPGASGSSAPGTATEKLGGSRGEK